MESIINADFEAMQVRLSPMAWTGTGGIQNRTNVISDMTFRDTHGVLSIMNYGDTLVDSNYSERQMHGMWGEYGEC